MIQPEQEQMIFIEEIIAQQKCELAIQKQQESGKEIDKGSFGGQGHSSKDTGKGKEKGKGLSSKNLFPSPSRQLRRMVFFSPRKMGKEKWGSQLRFLQPLYHV